MIPQKLIIEGLYSYQERQTIDFNYLTEAGLFGIFGTVGSGKSSILEAITFALYGNSDRLGGTNFAYNMMNLKSNRLYIEFEFSNHENKLFKITREYKRNKNHFEKITNSGVVLYAFENNHWLPLPSANVEPIIGLSSENFRRTIIIPQGQFKEFIELKPTARTQMMKELFGLHRFDLLDKTSNLSTDATAKLNQLEGKLSGFDTVSQEQIQTLETNLASKKELEHTAKKQFETLHEQIQILKILKSDFENLNQKKIDFQQLEEQKVGVEQEKQRLEHFELVSKTFAQPLQDVEKIEAEIQASTKNWEEKEKEALQTNEQLEQIKKKLKTLTPEFENLAFKKQEENDLELIAQILDWTSEINAFRERTKKGLEKVKEVEEQHTITKNFIINLEEEIKVTAKKRLDSELILEVGNWFQKQKHTVENLSNQQKKIEDLEHKIKNISSESLSKYTNLESLEQDFNRQIHQLKTRKIDLEHQQSQLKIHEKLSEFANELHDGTPCPLCGAVDHPAILKTDSFSEELKNILEALKQLDADQTTVQNNYNQLKNDLDKKSFYEQQQQSERERLKEISEAYDRHLDTFSWSEFNASNPQEFEDKKKTNLQLEKELEHLNKNLSAHRQQLEDHRKNLELYNKTLEQFKIEEAQKTTQIEQNKAYIKILDFKNFTKSTKEDVLNAAERLKQKNKALEKDVQQLQEDVTILTPRLASQKTAVAMLAHQIESFNKTKEVINTSMIQSLHHLQLKDLNEVKEVLKKALDVQKLRKKLEEFAVNYKSLQQQILELTEKLKEATFNEQDYHEQEIKLNDATSELKKIQEDVAIIATEISRLQVSYHEKKELLKEHDALEKRKSNLNTMRQLFTGAGFVQYVSSIYLRQLCDQANMRFHRMTRNQLSLQLSDSGEFEIIDYLNEGKSRSVKTLSGGQSFQVSLSLALALTDSVQSNAKSEKNFFFIDEGFGTQDSDSVSIVFETLINLQKENRIVGVISHVEELKERIPVSLSVTKDEERGSTIQIN